MSAARCSACGAACAVDARFCSGCGKDLHEGDPTRVGPRQAPDVRVPEEVASALRPDVRVERLIGRGGMGEVYLAHDVSLERPIAVKVLPRSAAQDPDAVERFLREARVAAALRHPNIVPIHSVARREDVVYFTMDWIDGRNLSQLVRDEGPLPLEEACRILAGAADALAHAHGRQVVHRDVKPHNVILQADGHVYVTDFGLARTSTSASLTESGVVLGTPEYISPEQAEGSAATPAADAYALGLTLAFLLTGRHLVSADSFAATLVRHLMGEAQDLAAKDEALPETGRSLLVGMLAREPARRLADMTVLSRRLRTLAGATPPASPGMLLPRTPGPGSSPSPVPRSPTPGRHDRSKTRDRLRRLLDELDDAKEPD